MRVGIYTAHLVHNYGAQLQAYATLRFLQSIKPDCFFELVNVITSRPKPSIRLFISSLLPSHILRRKRFEKFHAAMPHSKTLQPDQLFAHPLIYDLHIVGSDQIWNVSNGMRKYPVYFLPFVKDKPKISLASSFGVSEIPDSVKKDVKRYLETFDSISVREKEGVKILHELGIHATQILDPTFWISEKHWSQLAGDIPIIQGNYVAAYGFELSNKVQSLIDAAQKIYSLPVIGLDAARLFRYDKTYNCGGPKEFLNIIKFSKVVITGSFHGTAFSIIFRKNFFVLPHSLRNSRIQSLLETMHLNDRLLYSDPEGYFDAIKRQKSIDYESINPIISDVQKQTRTYISQILNKYH